MEPKRDKQIKIDWLMFITTFGTILLLCIPILSFKDYSAHYITSLYDKITQTFGVVYLWYGFGALLFLIWLATSKFGKIRLGDTFDKPEFNTRSWVGMLFCAGVGAGLLYWAVLEWGYYLNSPPYGLESKGVEATEWASSYGLFHWGPSAWAIYCLPTIAIAYPYYVRKIPYLRLSTSLLPFLPKGVNSSRGRFIDFLFMINLIGGTGTSLGLSSPMIAGGIAKLLNISHNYTLEVSVVLISIAIFGTSSFLGLKKGFKKLSDFNVFLAFVLLFFVLAVGPTIFILKVGTNSIGLVLQNFIRMNLWTDPIRNSGFVENWTIFYWAWWVAYAPFVGIFVTRISRGRSIKQIIMGMLIFGSLGAWGFFIVFGNYGLYLELNEILNITGLMEQGSREAADAISVIMTSLPFGKLTLTIFVLIALIFLATTYDSASYSLASVSTKKLKAGQNPARWNRLFWALSLGVLPITLLFVDGGLKVILSTTIIVSLPLLFVGVMMGVSLVKMLKEDHKSNNKT
ncbi:BCCT family transporter [Lutimonas sp.]|uniref:BCCT family transporter n=1 Tax=Lutimonas sp. TaxID=1872403 RepID=UPI003D9B4471